MLNEYPDDEEIYLLNIAARTSQAGEIKEEKVRERMHDGIIIDAQEALQSPRFNKKIMWRITSDWLFSERTKWKRRRIVSALLLLTIRSSSWLLLC